MVVRRRCPTPDKLAAHPRRRRRRSLAALVVVAASAALLSACVGLGGGSSPNSITLYNGQHPQLTQALVKAFEKKTGIHVKVRTDDGILLADQILVEGSHSPADVYLTENSPELMLLSQHHMLTKLAASTVDQIPSRFNSPTQNWIGISRRVSALAYNPSKISAAQLPASLLDLSQPEWKGKVGFAPTDSDFPPLVGGVIATKGTAAARRWLAGLKRNANFYSDDESVVNAVNRAFTSVGIVNAYYWYRLRLEVGAGGMHSKLYFFPNHDIGGLENISGAGVLASSHNKTDAEKFVAFLASAHAQRILAAGNTYEYPTRPGIAPNPALPPLSRIKPSVVNVVRLGNDRAAALLLEEVELT
jgi:iron(III) transport system substrate-binding protein